MMMMMMTHVALGCGCKHVAGGAVRGARGRVLALGVSYFRPACAYFWSVFFGVVEVFIEKPNNCIVCPFVRVCVYCLYTMSSLCLLIASCLISLIRYCVAQF